MALSYSPKIKTDGLVLYLDAANRESHPGSGTVWTDLIKKNIGTYQNGPTFSSDYGGCMNFVGLNTYVWTYADSSYAFGTGDFAIETWVWMNSLNAGVTPFLQSDPVAGSTADKWWFGYTSSGLYLGKHSGGGSVYCNWSPSTNRWYHVVASRTSSSYSLFIDGVSQSVQGSITNSSMGQNGISIGGMSTPYWLNGKISVVKLYNKGMIASEVMQNYGAIKSRYGA